MPETPRPVGDADQTDEARPATKFHNCFIFQVSRTQKDEIGSKHLDIKK